MARLRRSKRIPTSAAKIANQSGAPPASQLATDSRAKVDAEACEGQEKSGIYGGTTSMKRPAPVEDLLSGIPNLTRRRQKRGLKAARKLGEQAYKPQAEEELEEPERTDEGQASSITTEGLDIDQTTAPKKAKARKSVRFVEFSPGRLQKGTHRRPQSEHKEHPRGNDLEEDFPSNISDSDVQDFVQGEIQVKDGNTRGQTEENEVNHS